MAVIRGIECVYGVEFNYHKINSVSIIRCNGELQLKIIVASWYDKEARLEGKQPVLTENIIQNADFALEPFYKLLKAKFEDYMDSEDDWEKIEGDSNLPVIYTQQTPSGRIISQNVETPDTDSDKTLDEAALEG